MIDSQFSVQDVKNLLGHGKDLSAGKRIRGWFRQGRIRGAVQRQKHAQIWLSADGVHEAWLLWARHQGLDQAADMPEAIRSIVDGAASGGAVADDVTAEDPVPVVRVLAPAGVRVMVEYA